MEKGPREKEDVEESRTRSCFLLVQEDREVP